MFSKVTLQQAILVQLVLNALFVAYLHNTLLKVTYTMIIISQVILQTELLM